MSRLAGSLLPKDYGLHTASGQAFVQVQRAGLPAQTHEGVLQSPAQRCPFAQPTNTQLSDAVSVQPAAAQKLP